MLFDLLNDPHETKNLAGDEKYFGEIGRLSRLLKAEQQRLGDKLPLVFNNPKPAEFGAPKDKLPTPYPAGGLAPGIAPEPNRPKPAEITGADEMLNSKRGRYQIIHPSQPETVKRLGWFTDAKFGMFVHWGTVRQFAPNALINSRIAHGSENTILHADLFDYLTLGDQEIPESKLPLYSESPDSITVSYG